MKKSNKKIITKEENDYIDKKAMKLEKTWEEINRLQKRLKKAYSEVYDDKETVKNTIMANIMDLAVLQNTLVNAKLITHEELDKEKIRGYIKHLERWDGGHPLAKRIMRRKKIQKADPFYYYLQEEDKPDELILER